MPAKNTIRVDRKGIYSHIFNKGISKQVIFSSDEDYEMFIEFLKDYLSPSTSSEDKKKTFTVKGKTYKGVPHQPKNYFGQIDLIAYSLMPNHFHLLLHQKTNGSIQKFIRSLCTRYSMYFNKKYGRTGSLFEGPYKSIQVKGSTPLLLLTRFLHAISEQSSYQEFLGERDSSWVKPKALLALFEKSQNDSFKGVEGYRKFVEKYELSQEDQEMLEGIIIEDESEHLERREPVLERTNLEETDQMVKTKSQPRIAEFAIATAVFALLLGIGLKNIKTYNVKAEEVAVSSPSPTPTVSGDQDSAKITLIVKIADGAANVNIRSKPTTRSEIIGSAHDGDTFEYVSIDSGWYETKMVDGSSGFISARYIQILEGGEN